MTLLTLAAVVAGMPANGHTQRDARAIWKDVIKKCAQNDLLGSKLLFTGPSNAVGPAAVYKRGGGGYRLVWEGTDGFDGPTLQTIIKENNSVSCGGRTHSESNFDVGLLLGSLLSPITGGLGIDLKKARTITLAPRAWQWDEVKTGPYEREIVKPYSASYRASTSQANHYVVLRALRVNGLAATLEFDKRDAAELKTKYPNALKLNEDPASLEFSVAWTGDSKLDINTNSEFYLVADLGRYTQTGAAGNPAKLASVNVPDQQPVVKGREEPASGGQQ